MSIQAPYHFLIRYRSPASVALEQPVDYNHHDNTIGTRLSLNIYLTDENVHGPAIKLALDLGVQIIRDVDTDIPCDVEDYDQCLFDYASRQGYIVVTANIRDFEPKFFRFAESGEDHPGLILIRREHRSSTYLIAEWLALWSEEDFTNRLVRLPPD